MCTWWMFYIKQWLDFLIEKIILKGKNIYIYAHANENVCTIMTDNRNLF